MFQSIFDLFKKKRRAVLVNGVLTVTLVNKTILVFHNADKELCDMVNDKTYSDEEIQDHYNFLISKEKDEKQNILEKLAENQARQSKGNDNSAKTVTQIIAAKEVKKQELNVIEKEKESEFLAIQEAKNKFPTLIATGDFEEENGCLYMKFGKKRINISIPKLIIKKFIILVQGFNKNDSNSLDEYCALKNFWLWCSLCPNPQSREDLFSFLEKYRLKINKYGMFFAYRKVDRKGMVEEISEIPNPDTKLLESSINEVEISEEDTTLSEFISSTWLKIKSNKKSPKNFTIYTIEEESDGEEQDSTIIYKYIQTDKIQSDKFDKNANIIGIVSTLYESLSKDNIIEIPNQTSSNIITKIVKVQRYTDNYTHTMDIRIGKEVSLPPEKCDWNNLQSCSNGLHIRGESDHGCGDTSILVLINPMNAVAVPTSDQSKMRVRAYLPVATLKDSEDMKILKYLDTLEIADDYYNTSITEFTKMLETSNPKELIKHRYITPDLDIDAIKLITSEPLNAKNILKKRVVNG